MAGLVKKNLPSGLPRLILEGFRITLRPPRREDGAAWLSVREENRLYLKPFEPAWPRDAAEPAYFNRRLELQAADWTNGRSLPFLIFLADGTLIGGVNINNICRGAAQFASLGYWLGEQAQGHGYMAEALQLVLYHGFTALKLHRFHAACLPHNDRSRSLLLKSGFQEEGHAAKYMEINGQWQDHILFGLPVENWKGAAV